MKRKTLVLRVDAGPTIGIGHLVRCLAIAQGWQARGGEALFVTRAPHALRERLLVEGCRVEPIDDVTDPDESILVTAQIARRENAAWVVLDGYQFVSAHQRNLKEEGFRVLAIDDHGHADRYTADLILNQNLHASESLYAGHCDASRLLLGNRFVLLRREFLEWRKWRRDIPPFAEKILVTLGGSDPRSASRGLLEVLTRADAKRHIRLIVGPVNQVSAHLLSAATRSPGTVEVVTAVERMPDEMAWADLAIAAAGSTSWELAFMGLPAALVVSSENQILVAETLESAGVAHSLGRVQDLDSQALVATLDRLTRDREVRSEMSKRGRALIDGHGTSRLMMNLLDEPFWLREVESSDRELVWSWANEPEVRRQSFRSEPIPWERHADWFKAKLGNPYCVMLIALDPEDEAVGQVRFDLEEERKAVISVSLSVDQRGRGLGPYLIEIAIERLRSTSRAETVHAFIKPGNAASVASFKKVGFEITGEKVIDGSRGLHLERRIERTAAE